MATNTLNVRMKQAVRTEAEWTSDNPVLLEGEVAYSSDKNNMYKVGDGTKTWSQLNYSGGTVHVVKGTQTATTASWTGNIDVSALYDGLTIAYYLPRTSASNVTLNLTLNDGTTTGAIPVYVTSTTRMTTHYSAGSTVYLTYWSAGSISVNGTVTTENRWTSNEYWNSNTIGEYGGACTAGTNGLARYSLALQTSSDTWESLVTTSSTSANKVKTSNGFLLTSPIVYQNTDTYTEGSNAGQSDVWITFPNFNTRFSFNVSTSWSAAGRPLYLVGTIAKNDEGYPRFYLKDTTWWSDTPPSTNDGYYYWYVGQMYTAYQATLYAYHPIYYYDGGLKVYNPTEVTEVNGHTVNADVPSGAKFTDTVTTATTTGSGNAVTAISASNGALTVTKGTTFLTSHQTIKQDGITGATATRFGTCSTAAATAAKTVSITSGTFNLETGARVTVKFSNANTANSPTLNVNSKGAKNIFHRGSQITSGANKALLAGTVDFVYDGTQWNLIGSADKTEISISTNQGLSYLNLASGGIVGFPQGTVSDALNIVFPIPSNTSDLTNDSGFISSIPIASSSTLGGIKVGDGLSIAADGTLSSSGGSGGTNIGITYDPTNETIYITTGGVANGDEVSY